MVYAGPGSSDWHLRQHWDFDHSKRDDDVYYHQSGSGGDPLSINIGRFSEPQPPPGLLWTAPDVRLHRWVSKEKPEVAIRSNSTLLKMGYRRLSRPLVLRAGSGHWGGVNRSRNPFLVCSETDSHLAYCKVCDDRFPSEQKCEHLEWCDRCAWLVYVDTHVREDEPEGAPTVHGETEDDDQ